MISYIILNYNTSLITCACVDSIYQQLGSEPGEVIVVDNGSCNEEYALLCQRLEGRVQIIRSQMNTGFGAGNLLGANFAKGDYLCFLNNDVILTEDCVTPLCHYLDQHGEVGCITPQQYDGQGHLVRAFNHLPGLRYELCSKRLLERLFPSRYPSRKRLYDTPFEVAQINGCFMLFRSSDFWQMGGFDINLFLYYEEYDIAMRLAALGMKCVVHPCYSFTHLHEQSTSRNRKLIKRETMLSELYIYRKYHSGLQYQLFKWINILKLLPKVKSYYILPSLIFGETLSQSMRHIPYKLPNRKTV